MIKNSDITGTVQKDHAKFAQQELEQNGYKDWEVVVAKNNELQLDYDCGKFPKQFHNVMDILRQRVEHEGSGVLCYSHYKSKGNNWHVIVHLPCEIEFYERIAWQAAFGSDFKREALSLLALSRNELNTTLLYMKKDRQDTPIPVQAVEAVGRKFKNID